MNKYYCRDGTFSEVQGASSSTICEQCPAGAYCTQGKKTACSAGTYSAPGSISCSNCEAGYYCPGGSNRIICGAGTYSTGGESSCRNCSVPDLCRGGNTNDNYNDNWSDCAGSELVTTYWSSPLTCCKNSRKNSVYTEYCPDRVILTKK